MNCNKIQDIKKARYEGYLWFSDQTSPIIYNGDTDFEVEERPEAFIVEGMLWDSSSHTSVRIDYHDGQQHIYETIVKPEELDGCDYTTVENYIPHRFPGIKQLSFLRYWHLVVDDLCEGFEVLSPQKLIFIGFKK